jgi:hypothetical protein
MSKKPLKAPWIRKRSAEAARLVNQLRREPVQWKRGEREALIEQALSTGKVSQCPAAHAYGSLVFNAGSTVRPMFGAKHGGAL